MSAGEREMTPFGLRWGRGAVAALAVVMLGLSGCSAEPVPEETEEVAEPVSYPVPEGCPTAEDFSSAYVDDPTWADALAVEHLDSDVSTPLPAGGCAYAEHEVRTADDGSSTYRRVYVWYFNLGEPGKSTASELAAWATSAGGTVSPDDDDDYDLPTSLTGWTGADLAMVDGDASSFGWTEDVIPDYTQGANGRIEFMLGADRVDALVEAAESGGEAPDSMTGIIAIENTERGYGSIGTITLTALDPTSGAATATRTFTFPTDVTPNLNAGNPYFARQAFDPDLRRIAATQTFPSDGSTHAGWVTATGQFVDVTAAVSGQQSDFSSAIKHTSPAFGADGSFYFLDSQTSEIKRISPEAAAAPETATPETVLSETDSDFFVWPSGTVAPCGACIPHVEYKTAGGAYGYGARVSDWLDDNTIVCTTTDDHQIIVVAPYPGGTDVPSGRWGCGADDTDRDLLPSTDRRNWNPISSPDGQTVAFISQAGVGESAPELFVISRNGGDPTKVTTSVSFERTADGWLGSSNRLQLLDWR